MAKQRGRGQGEGSIFKRRDGRWCAGLDLGAGRKGQRYCSHACANASAARAYRTAHRKDRTRNEKERYRQEKLGGSEGRKE